MRPFLVLAAIVLFLPLATAWPQGGGGVAHSYVTDEEIPETLAWAKEMRLRGAAIQGGVLFASYASGHESGRAVGAYQLHDGKALWTNILDNTTEDPFYRVSSPVEADGGVFVADNHGRLWRLDSSTGSVVWQVQITDGKTSMHPARPHFASGQIIVAMDVNPDGKRSELTLFSIDARDGSVDWQRPEPLFRSGIASDSSAIYYTKGNALVALDHQGSVRWELPVTHEPYSFSYVSPPALRDGVLYAVMAHQFDQPASPHPDEDGDGQPDAQDLWSRLLAIDAADGNVRWHHDSTGTIQACCWGASGPGQSPSVSHEQVVFATGHSLEAVGLGGQVKWSTPLPGWPHSPPVQGQSQIIVPMRDNIDDQGEGIVAFTLRGQKQWHIDDISPRFNGDEPAASQGYYALSANVMRPGVPYNSLVVLGPDTQPPIWPHSAGLYWDEHRGQRPGTLIWSDATDMGLAGYRVQSIVQGAWEDVAFVDAIVNVQPSWPITKWRPDAANAFRVVAVDEAGNPSIPSNTVQRYIAGDGRTDPPPPPPPEPEPEPEPVNPPPEPEEPHPDPVEPDPERPGYEGIVFASGSLHIDDAVDGKVVVMARLMNPFAQDYAGSVSVAVDGRIVHEEDVWLAAGRSEDWSVRLDAAPDAQIVLMMNDGEHYAGVASTALLCSEQATRDAVAEPLDSGSQGVDYEPRASTLYVLRGSAAVSHGPDGSARVHATLVNPHEASGTATIWVWNNGLMVHEEELTLQANSVHGWTGRLDVGLHGPVLVGTEGPHAASHRDLAPFACVPSAGRDRDPQHEPTHYEEGHVATPGPAASGVHIEAGSLGIQHTAAGEGRIFVVLANLGTHDARADLRIRVDGHTAVTESVTIRAGSEQLWKRSVEFRDGSTLDVEVVDYQGSQGDPRWTGRVEIGLDKQESPDNPRLIMSAGLVNIGTVEAGQSRTIPFQVTAYTQMAHGVQLRVLDDAGLDVRVLTPAVDIEPGQTIDFYVQVTGTALAENETALGSEIVVQAVSGNGRSNVETLTVVSHQAGFLGIPFLGVPLAAGAVATGGGLAALFPRRR